MKKILVVEDENSMLSAYKTMITNAGYDVLEAGDGLQALKKLNEKPNLILLDLVMPNIDGPDFLQKLSESGEYKNIPVIIVTALPMDAAKQSVEGLTYKELLSKTDYSPKQILKKIKKYVK